MHNNFYFFKQMVPVLEEKLKGSALIDCFSQSKDELILNFGKLDIGNFYIKAYLTSHFSCLSFPSDFHRARKNSATLFGSVTGQRVTGMHLFENERSFVIQFANEEALLFKMHGNRSNIILTQEDKPVELFKSSLKKDLTLDSSQLNRTLDLSFEKLLESGLNIQKVAPTLDKASADTLLNLLLPAPENKRKALYDTFLQELENPDGYYVYQNDKGYILSILKPQNKNFKFYKDPLEAITFFFNQQVKYQALSSLKEKILSGINNQLVKSGNYVIKSKQKLQQLLQGTSNKQIADVLMANIHAIAKGSKQIELYNFYTSKPITIKLNPLQSAQKNAERFYRKAKNEEKEISVLKQNIAFKEQHIEHLNQLLNQVQQTEDLKVLKQWQMHEKEEKSNTPLPYKEFWFDDYKVLVGKNAKHNDELTLKVAKKEDLWLHAKDVSGSHVVIKQIPGKTYPQYIIEKAAQLAAFYSKRKTDSLCPVLYTPKKFVRKPKGSPAGAVVVEKEKVILVEPLSNP